MIILVLFILAVQVIWDQLSTAEHGNVFIIFHVRFDVLY